MGPNILYFGWTRSLPGREPLSAKHFGDFNEFLAQQQKKGAIDSFEAVLLEPHGDGTHGFFVIRGEPSRLGELAASPDWIRHITRAMLHLEGTCVVRGVTGQALGERMALWMDTMPRG